MKKLLLIAMTLALMSVLSSAQTAFSFETYDNGYLITFNMPSYSFSINETQCGTFYEVGFPENTEHSMTDVSGLPQIPLLSLSLQLPCDASNIQITVEDATYDEINIEYPLVPATYVTSMYSIGMPCYDSAFYNIFASTLTENDFASYYGYLYNHYYTPGNYIAKAFCEDYFWSIINYRQTTGISFTISPFLYSAIDAQLRVLQTATFRIEFDTELSLSETLQYEIDDMSYSSYCVKNYYDNYAGETWTYDQMRMLMLVQSNLFASNLLDATPSDETTYNLARFQNDKENNSRTVSIRLINNQNDVLDIEQTIRDEAPDMVLLVGDTTAIPFANAGSNEEYQSDRDYSINDIAVGRWVVNESDELPIFIEKTLSTENNCPTKTNLKAALFSGTDSNWNHAYMEWEFNRLLRRIDDECFEPNNMQCNIYYGNEGTNFDTMRNVLDSIRPYIFVYSGHGSIMAFSNSALYQTGLSTPYRVYPDTSYSSGAHLISSFRTSQHGVFPLSFGFACSLNNFQAQLPFGALWISTPNHGGASFYGATMASTTTTNHYLSMRIFRTLGDYIEQDNGVSAGELVNEGALKYYNMFKTTTRKEQMRKYMYLGDPSIAMYQASQQCYAPSRLRISCENEEIYMVNIFDIEGNLICSQKDGSFSLSSLPLIYIKQIIYTDGTCITSKYYKL